MIKIMAYRHSAFYSPLLAAISAGFLQAEGLEPVYFLKPRERNLYEMFRSGEVDLMQAAVSTSWDPLSRGQRDIPKHFAQINQKDGFFIVGRSRVGLRKDKPFTWKDLEGAEVLADHAQQPLVMLKYALHLQGVDWSRVRAGNEGDPDAMERAFREGKGDYVHLQGPAPQQVEKDGLGFVVACVGDAMPPLAFSSLMAMPSFLETAEARAFMRAYRRALAWVNDQPAAEVADKVMSLFTLSKVASIESLTAAIARYQELGTWRRDPAIPRDQYEVSLDAFMHAGVFARRFPYEDVVVPPPSA